ncbi:MAG: MAPEG family protein [Gammaproteobacteria bacterium]|nr:MAPEG family protein [Gammaproteobacteria bacterium]
MTLVILIIILALMEYMLFTFRVGMARGKYGIQAPAITGNPEFERYFRVQQNTLEQLIVFIPAILAFSWMAESIGWPGNYIASGLGVIWIIGRYLYASSYVRDPVSRSIGFMMTFLPSALMLVGTLVCILISFV